jgi:hypothetical protein
MRSAAFSATMMVGAFVLPLGTVGNTEASTTLRPWGGGKDVGHFNINKNLKDKIKNPVLVEATWQKF